ncbi:MAG: 3'-5' exonuclease [Myxococcota bacterium]|jgi:DNA polymerase-3 subunit epsilon|nr:3'-5' exonuclease [Myxococcota bacterium]
MFSQLERPIIFFDTATTGIDPQKDRIVELAALKLFPDGTQEEKRRRFNPGIPIPKEATAVHGITDAEVRKEPPFSKFAKGEQGIAQYFSQCDLAGFNLLDFDIPILQAELERCGESLELSDAAIIDVYRIFAHKEPQTLAGAARFYCGQDHRESLTALCDVRMALKVFEAQLVHYGDLGTTPAQVDQGTRPDGAVDRVGKLRWDGDDIVLSFGRNRGRTLRSLVAEERDYLLWMIANRVVDPAGLAVLRDALLGHFPPRRAS